MRELYPGLHGATKEDAELYFPELKESNDEKIRKEAISIVQSYMNICDKEGDPCLSGYKVLDWLEKQKEIPKSADSIPSDCVTDAKCENLHNEEGDFVFELRQIISSHRYSDIYGEYINDEEAMASEILELCKCELERQKEQKPAEYLSKEKVFAIMNKLTSLSFCVPLGSDEEKKIHEITCDVSSLLDYPIEQKQEQKPAEWSEEDEERIQSILFSIGYCKDEYPNKKDYSKDIDRLKSLRPQQKVEWSEDDEGYYNAFMCEVVNEKMNPTIEQVKWLRGIRDRLKSFCSQPQQKPEAKLTGWVARDKEFDSYFGLGLILFKEKPRRSGNCWSGEIASQLPWELFPDLKCEDEPVEVEVTIRRK